jgi:predicted transport protein
MSDIKLFQVQGSKATNLSGTPFKLEKDLQDVMEKHMDVMLKMRFVASEHSTGKNHAGRIDSLALDENGCPVIIEYKRNANANVINQGLYYLDWLLDHKAEFEMLILKKYGQEVVDSVDWTGPRLLCIAQDFNKYDAHAVQQINRNIELIQYIHYPDGFLALNLVNAVSTDPLSLDDSPTKTAKGAKVQYKTITEYMAQLSDEVKGIYEEAREYMLDLGDDVLEKELKYYIAFRRMKNFVTVQCAPTKGSLYFYLNLNPDTVDLEKDFSSDLRKVGHQGTGDLELKILSMEDLEKAKPLIKRSFEEN